MTVHPFFQEAPASPVYLVLTVCPAHLDHPVVAESLDSPEAALTVPHLVVEVSVVVVAVAAEALASAVRAVSTAGSANETMMIKWK